jgi:hypothetical protein
LGSALILAAVATAPVIEAVLIARLSAGRWLGSFVSFFSDEIDYWHETATFLASGFAGGHYGWNEQAAGAGWSHFGPHGPVVELVYGLPGALFGWSNAAPLLVNLVLFAGATAIALWLAGPLTHRVALGVGIVLCTFWPLMLYLPSAMEEPVNQAVAIVLAGGFARVLRAGGASRRLWGSLLALIVAASLLRVAWSLLLLAWVALYVRGFDRRRQILLFAAAVAGIVLLFAFYAWTAAPYPLGIDYQIQHAHGLGGKLSMLWSNTKLNFQLFLHLRARDSTTLETVLRFEVVAVLLAVGGWLLARWRRPRLGDAGQRDLMLVTLVVLAPMVIATIVAWQVGAYADFRALAPYLLLVLVLGVLVGGRLVRYGIGALVLVNLAFVGSYVSIARQWDRLHFRPDTAVIARSRQVFDAAIRTPPGASDWCRTMLWGIDYVPPALLAVPRQVGVELSFTPATLHPPLRSGYVMLPPGNGALAARDGLRTLARLPPYGQLYSNPSAGCPQGRP